MGEAWDVVRDGGGEEKQPETGEKGFEQAWKRRAYMQERQD